MTNGQYMYTFVSSTFSLPQLSLSTILHTHPILLWCAPGWRVVKEEVGEEGLGFDTEAQNIPEIPVHIPTLHDRLYTVRGRF